MPHNIKNAPRCLLLGRGWFCIRGKGLMCSKYHLSDAKSPLESTWILLGSDVDWVQILLMHFFHANKNAIMGLLKVSRSSPWPLNTLSRWKASLRQRSSSSASHLQEWLVKAWSKTSNTWHQRTPTDTMANAAMDSNYPHLRRLRQSITTPSTTSMQHDSGVKPGPAKVGLSNCAAGVGAGTRNGAVACRKHFN